MATTPSNQANALTVMNIQNRIELLRALKKFAENVQQDIGQFRTLLRYRDRAYQLQLDQSAQALKVVQQTLTGSARRKISDISVPVAMPQIESAVAYQTGVFLSSYPIFGVVAGPAQMSAAMQMETVIGNHAKMYGWSRALIRTFRKGFKYNFGPVFVHWKKHKLHKVVSSTEADRAGLAEVKQEDVGGNCITDLDPYNCIFDFRINPSDYHLEGEAFIWNSLISRTALKRLISTLDPANPTRLREAFESGTAASAAADAQSVFDYYVPDINMHLRSQSLGSGSNINWLSFMGIEGSGDQRRIQYKDFYTLTSAVIRALPSDFGMRGNVPKLYYALVVNWCEVIYVEELVSAHDLFPVVIYQPNDDGLGHQSQSMLDTALPFQDMSSAIWNMNLESKRRAVFDRLLYNPKIVNKEDIDPASSVARIPIRNASLLRDGDLSRAVFQIPYREDATASNLQMSEMISQMADVATGQNKVDRGQFQKGNKTKVEFERTMDNSGARQQLTAITTEEQFFTPVKEIVRTNMLLFQGSGPMLNQQSRDVVEIDPTALRNALLEFKLTDGMLPADKMLNSDLLMVFMQTAQAMPVFASEYDVMGMFLYWAKLRGAYWLEDFKRNPQQQGQFLDLYTKTSMAQNATPPQQIPNGGIQP